jgi:hypothetical protein
MNETIPTIEQPASKHSKLRRGFRYALIGLIFGFIGLGTAAYRMSIEVEPPPQPARQKKEISDVLSDTIKKTVDKLRDKVATQQISPAAPTTVAWPLTKKLGLVASILGFVGAVFGCISWLVGEHRRWTWAALCVGIAALAWTHVVIAVSMAVGFFILIWLLGNLA